MIIKTKLTPTVLIAVIFVFTSVFFFTSNSYQINSSIRNTAYYCGVGSDQVQTTLNFGCHGNACPPNGSNCPYSSMSPIADILFSLIRFLSVGVGLIIVASMIWAGLQYIGSRGEPQSTEAAINRIRSNIIALVLFIFSYAVLSFVIPPGYLL